ncbi:phospholipase D family protein [Herbaspirillum huttiense]|jgi:phosphatidylserine/phosphatidylglycerophosphate/cardiolipin synthase-like enzyme|uniref:phospholipase D family nuclease n=1 Tax=Herbaspirillum TaxID=963 RepID=UPI001C2B8D09|nr:MULTISPECIES: phospholipase D family protein [unclassified Herbaspirillum]
MKKIVAIGLLMATMSTATFANGILKSLLETSERYSARSASIETLKLPPEAIVEVGFSPEGSAEALVLKTIDSARKQIRMMAYAFTSPKVVKALLAAHKRGVDVKLLVDAKTLEEEGRKRSQPGNAAVSTLVEAGVEVRTIDKYQIQHEKTFVVDGRTVELGSYNFTQGAATRNGETAMVISNAPNVAKVYLDHWATRWPDGKPYKQRY